MAEPDKNLQVTAEQQKICISGFSELNQEECFTTNRTSLITFFNPMKLYQSEDGHILAEITIGIHREKISIGLK